MSVCNWIGYWFADQRWVRLSIIACDAIPAGVLIALLAKFGQNQPLLYIYLVICLLAAIMSIFFFMKRIIESDIRRDLEKSVSLENGCDSAMSTFIFDVIAGVLVPLFAILNIQQQVGCRDPTQAFSTSSQYCPMLNSALAFGLISVPFYLSALLLQCGVCCLPTSRQSAAAAQRTQNTSSTSTNANNNTTASGGKYLTSQQTSAVVNGSSSKPKSPSSAGSAVQKPSSVWPPPEMENDISETPNQYTNQAANPTPKASVWPPPEYE
ncbi:hypothetical protein MIR68_002737 [Amoeboaphelidium protococcarum]|nr:hypothetical protein MIR68_002737 [Amoeboaphelidium protococcarum]